MQFLSSNQFRFDHNFTRLESEIDQEREIRDLFIWVQDLTANFKWYRHNPERFLYSVYELTYILQNYVLLFSPLYTID